MTGIHVNQSIFVPLIIVRVTRTMAANHFPAPFYDVHTYLKTNTHDKLLIVSYTS